MKWLESAAHPAHLDVLVGGQLRLVYDTGMLGVHGRVADGTHQGLIFPGGDLVHAMLAYPTKPGREPYEPFHHVERRHRTD